MIYEAPRQIATPPIFFIDIFRRPEAYLNAKSFNRIQGG
ncbi:MAG: hypothetical protein JWO45_328, partial [Spartobacteria bacterium]|nr:hypothetical protein [Spartobacteria bacterium]